MWWLSKDGVQEKKSKDDDDSQNNVQQLTQLNWVDNIHWTCVGDDDSGDAGNDIDGVVTLMMMMMTMMMRIVTKMMVMMTMTTMMMKPMVTLWH